MSDLRDWAQSLHDTPHHARCLVKGRKSCDCYRATRPEYARADQALALLSEVETLRARYHAETLISNEYAARTRIAWDFLEEALGRESVSLDWSTRVNRERTRGRAAVDGGAI